MAELLEIAQRVCGWAREGEEVEVIAGRGRTVELRAYEGEIEKLSSAESAGIGVRVVRDHRQGFAYAGSLDDDVLAETLADARDNAAYGDPDDAVGLAVPDGEPYAELDLFRDDAVSTPTERKVELVLELERALRAADARVFGLDECDYADGASELAIVTTTGISATGRETYAYLAAAPLAEQDGETQVDWWFDLGRSPSELDVEACAREAVDRTVRLLGARKPATERTTIVLDPTVTAELLGIIGSILSAEDVLKGRSIFAERVGEEVASPLVSLVEDPRAIDAPAATSVDGEGLATRRTALVADGVLQGFLHDSYTARRFGTRSTGSAVRSFSSVPHVGCRAVAVAPGTSTPAELLAAVGDGIYVQNVSGLHSGVNEVSGDFSTGASGLRIAGGTTGEPLREFTIASTLQRLLLDVAAVGNDLRWSFGPAAGVTLVIPDVTVSGA